ncbi:MAG: glycosyltransferase family 4 protein [Phototrophicaceae bacterium]
MRILMMMSSLAMGGGERTVLSLMPQFKALGHDITLLTLNKRRDSSLTEVLEASGVARIDLDAVRMLDQNAYQRFADLLRSGDFDIIHPQDQDTIIYGALAHRHLKMPAVMTRHVMDEPTSTLKETVRARLLLWVAKFGFDRVVTVSDAVSRHFHELTGIPMAKIKTVYNGLTLEDFDTQSQRASKRQELGWDAEQPIIVMVAVLRAGKGHEVLFDAIPKIKAAHPEARIKLVGGGELEHDLKAQAEPYMDMIDFMGQRSDVAEILGASDMLILPSWSEALPTVLIEAGAAGLPVVATDVGGTREIVSDGETGYVIPAGDATQLADKICALLDHPIEAQAMGAKAQAYIQQTFTLERQAQTLIHLYEDVLAAYENRL